MSEGNQPVESVPAVTPIDLATHFCNTTDSRATQTAGIQMRSYGFNVPTALNTIVTDILRTDKLQPTYRLRVAQTVINNEVKIGKLSQDEAFRTMSSAASHLSDMESDELQKANFSQLAQGFSELATQEAQKNLHKK